MMHSFNFADPHIQLRFEALFAIGFMLGCLAVIEYAGPKRRAHWLGLISALVGNGLFLAYTLVRLR
ncbi:MAG TPA: hypothetical protein VN778_05055 [Verrucomicrobiae bacterium]|nr:hypothetical protein [Verrucomicrobiae bacterium]